MTINGTENVQPLPSHIAGLIYLDFDNITSYAADGMNVQFPLQSLTTNIAKNRILGLIFNLVNVSVINEGFCKVLPDSKPCTWRSVVFPSFIRVVFTLWWMAAVG